MKKYITYLYKKPTNNAKFAEVIKTRIYFVENDEELYHLDVESDFRKDFEIDYDDFCENYEVEIMKI